MSGLAPTTGFALARAIALLAEDNLLRGVLLPSGVGLTAHAPAAAAGLLAAEACFLGAGLDSRALQPGQLFAALPGENVHGRRFAGPWLATGGWVLTDAPGVAAADELCGTPAAPGAGVLLCSDPQTALTALARDWRAALPVRVLGVTGTNGKTTTKDFLAALLRGAGPTHATVGNFNNFLGLPLTLLGLRADHRYAVIEMGASAVGEIDHLAGLAAPSVGLITNAAPAHLADFGSLDGIITGKGELLDHLPADGTAVLNADSPGFDRWRERAQCTVVSLGRAAGDHRWRSLPGAEGERLELDGEIWPVPLPGAHNAGNLAAAILAARAAGAGEAELRAGLAGFHGSPHRGVVLTIAGRIVLDDSYNANPASMAAAAAALVDLAAQATPAGGGNGGRAVAVLGHMAELGPDTAVIHRETGQAVAATGIGTLLAVGEIARPLGEGFDAAGGEVHYCASVNEAAAWLATHTRSGDRVLIKGSRSAGMERILTLLADACGGDRANQD